MVICPFAPYGLAHGPKTCQICHKLGPDFAERISLKLLDGFTPFKVSWTCLDLQLCNVIVICPFDPYGLAPGPKTCQMRQHLGQTLRNPYLWNHWMDLYHFEFYGIVWTCSCATTVIWPWPWIFKVKFWKCCISGMEEPMDMERKGCESIGCYTHFVTFNVPLTHDLDLGFSRSNFEKVISRE